MIDDRAIVRSTISDAYRNRALFDEPDIIAKNSIFDLDILGSRISERYINPRKIN